MKVNKTYCKHCKKRDDKPKQQVGVSRIHKKCLDNFIKATLTANSKKKREQQKKSNEKLAKLKKKHKETPKWHRIKAIELAKKRAIERDGTQCMKCGQKAPTVQIQASHVHSVGTKLFLAADPLNIKPLCGQCHNFWWHSNPLEASDWFKKKFPDRYKYLQNKIKTHQPGRVDWKTIHNSLKKK